MTSEVFPHQSALKIYLSYNSHNQLRGERRQALISPVSSSKLKGISSENSLMDSL